MPDHYKLSEFVNIFKEAYKTVDVRTAMLKHKDQWQIVAMVLRIRIAPEDFIKQEFHDQEVRYGRIDSEKVRVIQTCFPLRQLHHLTEGFSKGEITLAGLSLTVKPAEDILGQNGYFEYFTSADKKLPILDWPVLRSSASLVSTNEYYTLLQTDSEILRAIEGAGYHDFNDVVKRLIDVRYSSSSLINLIVEAEVPARIRSVEAIKKKDGAINLTIYVDAHKAVSDLHCMLRHYKSSPQEDILRQRVSLKLNRIDDSVQEWLGLIDLIEDMDRDTRIDVELISKDIGRLSRKTIMAWELLRIEERNPLFVALTRFCTHDEIKKLLERPGEVKIPQQIQEIPNKGRLFEVSIQWLLTSLGLRAVWLHGYEKMKTDKFDHGTVDCIAYHEAQNVLLLVNCTTGPPEQKETDRQKELQRLLRDQVFPDSTVKLYSVLFSATHRQAGKQKFILPGDMRIFYREDMERLLELVETGRETEFVKAIVSPFFSLI